MLSLPAYLAAQIPDEHLLPTRVVAIKSESDVVAAVRAWEGWDKAFRRAIVAGGPLKGARFTDVGWNDLKKAAKQYKADPCFNQYAKRCLSERAF